MNSNNPLRLRLLSRAMLVLGFAAWGFVAGHVFWFGLTRDLTKACVLADGSGLPPGALAGTDRREGPRLLKVMSYNLNHASRGNDNIPQNDPYCPPGAQEWEKLGISMYSLMKNPSRVENILDGIIAAIKAEDPDIVYLQEADRNMPESFGVDTASIIARGAGYPYAVWGAKWSMDLGVKYITGNAILSKYPIVKAENVPLNPITGLSCYRKLLGVHGALVATVDVGGTRVELINTHLYSKRYGYEKKAEQLRNLLKLVKNSTYPVIVGGDFNTSYARLANCEPCAEDSTLSILLRSNLVSRQGFFDEDTLDYLLLRPGDPTSYIQLYKLPTQTTDHTIVVSQIALGPEGDLVHRRALAGELTMAMNR